MMVRCRPLLKLILVYEILAVESGHTGISGIIASQEAVADHKVAL